MKPLFVFLLLIVLMGCKPPKYDQEITCPPANFHAKGVAVFDRDNSYIVVYPDGHRADVSRESCVVKPLYE